MNYRRYLPVMLSLVLGGFLGPISLAGEATLAHEVFKHDLKDVSQAEFQAVTAQLRQVQILRANFSQEKKIQALRRPLRSKGNFLFSTADGLFWKTTSPFDTVFVITPQGIKQISDGETTVSVKVEDQPVIHGFTEVFMAMFTGDTTVLKDKFKLYFSGDKDQWTLGLVPKGRMMKSMIHHIVLTGSDTVQHVDFAEKSGDLTKIEFQEVQANAGALNAGERKYFEDQ